MKKLLTVSCFILRVVYGQEKLGISNSNYAPAHSIHLNPSSSADSRTFLQLNLVGLNVFAKTNVLYLPGFSLRQMRSQGFSNPVLNEKDSKRYLWATAVVDGPTFTYSRNNFGCGFFVRGRSIAEARRVPYTLINAFIELEATEPPGNVRVRNAIISNMSWIEYGLNLSGIVKKKGHDLVTVGANLKYLTGINILYANFARLQGRFTAEEAYISELSARARNNTPAFGSGRGFALDLGFTYKKMLEHIDGYYPHSKRSRCSYVDYLYKIGFTLRDAGYLRFSPPGTSYDISGSGLLNTGGGANSLDDIFGPAFTFQEKNGISIMAAMPMLFSGQFDYNLLNNIYLNFTATKGIVPNSWTGVRSADLVSFTPRFEIKNFELALPLTFHRYLHPNIGAAFRIRSFVLGFDNILPLIRASNTGALNVYFSLGISLYRNPRCSDRVKRVDDCAPKPRIKKQKRKKRSYTMKNHR